MIHFRATLDEITPQAQTPAEPPPTAPSLPFRRPADYYSSPAGEARPLFPRWVPYGCGSAALVVLLLVFLLGYATSHGEMGEVVDLMFSSMQGELEKMFTRDVTAPQKAAFAEEVKRLREGVRTNRVSIEKLRPLMRSIREVSEDERVTPAEVDQLTREMRTINSAPPKKP